MPAILVVWFYTVNDVATFMTAVQGLGAGVATGKAGVTYRGTYSVSISSAAPDLEFRTYWGLADLGKLQGLNDFLAAPGTLFLDVLKEISSKPVMRSEIMGLTKSSTAFAPPVP